VLKAAALSPEQVRMFIVSDPDLNAFVAGGSNIFLHTGLMVETETPEMLLGVIAHETGHITGGHLIRADAFLEKAQAGSILTYLLGAAAIAGGGGEVGAAILTGAMHTSNQALLRYTRSNEQAADQAALGFLDTAGITAEGMLMMFERLRREEKQHVGVNQDVYARTHPLSSERIAHMRAHLKASSKQAKLSPALHQWHQRVRAKLVGFLSERTDVMGRYPRTDTSVPAHIARAVMHSNASEKSEALREVEAALKVEPNNAYLHELRGHILFKAGEMEASASAYRKAVVHAPNSPVLLSDAARPLVALATSEALAEAKALLQLTTSKDPTYGQSWQLLAQVYGKTGDLGMAELALAELAALNSNSEELRRHLARTEGKLDPYSPAALRAEDLRRFAKQLEKKEEEAPSPF
jgi:predicted Zn-dependent protease